MTTTLLVLAQRLTKDWGERVADTEAVAQVKEWIMDAFLEVAAFTDWGFLGKTEAISTVAAQRVYNVQVSAAEVTSGRIVINDWPITFVSKQDIVARGFDLELTDTYPKLFYNEGYDETLGQNKIGLYPIPVGIVALEFTENVRAAELADDSIIPLPSEFVTLLKYYVRGEQARDDQNETEYTTELNRFYRGLKERKGRFRTSTGPSTAGYMRLSASDVPRGRNHMQDVRFDPSHFQNR